ncbi:MAG: hypothetical protein U5R48_18145 [Gammaproteobacteria bacterium]|nr:hypothetical protein [Gammaproteobacteria bacterium]
MDQADPVMEPGISPGSGTDHLQPFERDPPHQPDDQDAVLGEQFVVDAEVL